MRPYSHTRRGLSVLAGMLLVLSVAACGGTNPQPAVSAPAPASSAATAASASSDPDAREELAGRAALAQDHSFTGRYSFDDGKGQPREVVATVGADGTWQVDLPGGGVGTGADVSIVSVAAGVYQCTLASPANPLAPTCLRLAKVGKPLPPASDPKVQRLFRQWLRVFTDRQAALSVTAVQPLNGAQGDCFSVDSSSASLKAPIDIGIYCYDNGGLLTAARVDFGVLKLINVLAGPATMLLPGTVITGNPLTAASASASA